MKSLKNIYFVQAGDFFGHNAYFPYSAGCVAAYAWDNPLIREHCRLDPFLFLRTPLEEAMAAFEEPFLVAFSNYVWNFEYNKALASAIKKRWPECLIVFGGHQVLKNSSRQLDDYPFVDYLIHQAGEIPFERLLLALIQGTDLGDVPSLSYRSADRGILRTAGSAVCENRDLPSPYLTGLFDDMIARHPDIMFSMTLETNRGCPYSCSYCEGAVGHKLHHMPMERIQAEIDWAARHKIEFINCADANFGMFQRDEAIVDYLIAAKLRTGYPTKVSVNFAKESNETVLRLNQKFNAFGLTHGATLSLQTLSAQVLENIGRKNLGFDRFRELVALYSQAGVPVYSEIIVGLPGETLESYTKGIGTLLVAGMHGALEVYICELLPNARMNDPVYREKHGVKGVHVRRYQRFGSPSNQDDFSEYSDLLCQTNAMPVADWVKANLFSTAVQGFHSYGLLICFAIFLFWEQQIPYERFYLDLLEYAQANPSTLIGELISLFEGQCQALSQGDGKCQVYYDPRFGEVTWPLGVALFLCAAYESERFYQELPGFLLQYRLDGEVEAQLLSWQRTMIHLPGPPPPAQTFDYDFPAYFSAAFSGSPPPLEKKRVTVCFPQEDTPENWVDFARINVWYGRRKGALIRKRYEVRYDEG